VAALEAEVRRAEPAARPGLAARRDELLRAVTAETLGRVAEEFDRVHSVQRAQRVGSVHTIIAPARLRAYLIDAVERGMARAP
jgi:hypothetical protein